MLTISQLAAYVGVTVRAIRHYHQRGLLPEPERDTSGYRRYGAQSAIDLIRIKILSDAGVPLARVEGLLHAEPEAFRRAVADIDRALVGRIAELERHRQQLAGLASGDGLVLPPEVVELLEELRSSGVSERGVRRERDGWILLMATAPDHVPGWAKRKAASLADPELRQLSRAFDQAERWEPDDPRLVELADAIVGYSVRTGSDLVAESTARDPAANALVVAYYADASPAWRRLGELCQERLRGHAGQL